MKMIPQIIISIFIFFQFNCFQNKNLVKSNKSTEKMEVEKTIEFEGKVEVNIDSIFLQPKIPESVEKISFKNKEHKEVNIYFKKKSVAVGKATRGRLINGRYLPKKGRGFIHNEKHSFATDETISYLIYAIGKTFEKFPDSVPIVIGSLSKINGGRLKPHKSHQNGRDVDIGYFYKENKPLKQLQKMHVHEIDIPKTWNLIENLIQTGGVEFIFMNYKFQKVFYEYAKNIGYDEKSLSNIFQYPRGRFSKRGIIRHSSGHIGHFHVRFLCPSSDKFCFNK